MAARKLGGGDIGYPDFDPGDRQEGRVFDFTSHERAREALELMLSMPGNGFNVFVLGENRSGRLTSTVEFLTDEVKSRPAPKDWVYVNNFVRSWEPIPAALPAGRGRKFRDRMAALVENISEALRTAFGGADFQKRVEEEGDAARQKINAEIESVQAEARRHGLEILQTPQGPMIVAIDGEGKPVPPDALTDEQKATIEAQGPVLAGRIRDISRDAATMHAALQERTLELGRQTADFTCAPLIDTVAADFSEIPDLTRWLVALKADIVENYRVVRPVPDDMQRPPEMEPKIRYAVNLLVDNQGEEHAPIVVEANPTYERLFGRIEYRQSPQGMETDFTLVRGGAFHRANGGILVLRADGVASSPGSWQAIKAALRDDELRIEEPFRSTGPAVAGAPSPQPIPLDLKVVLVGAPRWYYTFFSADPEFQSYVKLKADIDPVMEASPENIANYAGMIRQMAREAETGERQCDDAAISLLLGLASRWAADRRKLSSQFERISDVVEESCRIAKGESSRTITRELVVRALAANRRRNARIEDRIQEQIAEKSVLISTTGSKVGQVNALTVRDLGDHAFGTPSRVTASASVGRRGVVNIERDVGLGGPIQQKGALVLQGWLTGRFARRFPLSFNVSITFEQSYGGVEGDSASLAELVCILSDLSGVPVRQDLAITGSVNQHGEAQVIGGAHYKIEGFFRTCKEAGPLEGTQGAAVPLANEDNLIVSEEVAAAVTDGSFSIYGIASIEDAVELFMGIPAGEPDQNGNYPPETVFGKVAARLEEYDRILAERDGAF
jgi:predicted ATP-dependent protease